ncbi:MAG: plasma-membrane proton-efflux P-type ATPase [Ktedonobacteraceae bacterium]
MTISHQSLNGLTSSEAATRLAQYGPNEVSEPQPNALLALLGKFWAPVPWMLEATIVVTLLTARYLDAAIIGFLLVFNIVISFMQEGQAENALALLRHRLAITARVLRDGQWRQIAARDVVPGDVLHVRMGDVVPADVTIHDGALVVDQSPLTGESVPVEKGAGDTLYAGAVARQGEATGVVTATGAKTYFGKTTELVKTARTVSHLETVILTIVKYLAVIDVLLVVALLVFAVLVHVSLLDALPFALIVLVASVPVALPATFTLAQALGAREMATRGVLITRLSAIEEAASMDVLCTDKTGTITLNQLSVGQLVPSLPFNDDDLLVYGAIASDAASQDPLDLAILAAYQARHLSALPERLSFTPFDPARKRTEATIERDGAVVTVIKGAPQVVVALVPGINQDAVEADVVMLAERGYRVLAVAAGPEHDARMVGLIGLFDPPRPDSAALVANLHMLGVRTKMLTGDTVETARAIAGRIGIGGNVCDAAALHAQGARLDTDCEIFAGIFPEDKFHLVQSLQAEQHSVGMTGDGVNDAPALKQADVGIAVSSATDVAKAAAGIVLTTPGLLDILAAIQTSRRVYTRMHTYALNKIIKTIQVAVFLIVAFFITRHFVITPTLIVLLLFANDFVTMSIAADNAEPDPLPDRWRIRQVVISALALAAVLLVESGLILWLALDVFQQSLAQTQTLVFLMLVFSGQTTVYVVREPRHFWSSLPGRTLLIASACDLIVVSGLAILGILMTPVHPLLIGMTFMVALAFMLLLDLVKQWITRRPSSQERVQ